MKLNSAEQAHPVAFLTVILLLFLFPGKADGQYQDFRSWWDVDVSKDLTKDLQASLDFSQRFKSNSLRYDRSLLTAGLEYEIFKNFEVEAGYRFYLLQDDRMQLSTKYRINGDVSYAVELEDFEVQLRERLQYGFDDLRTIEEYALNKLTNRNKLTLEYDLFGSPITFFGSYELFTDISNRSSIEISDHRFELGIQYALSFKSDIEISYMLDKEVNTPNPLTAHVIVIGFGYDL